MTRVLLTAGFDRSLPAISLATLLSRDGVIVAGVIVVGVANPSRLRAYFRQRGFGFVVAAMRRVLSRPPTQKRGSPLRDFIEANTVVDRSLRRWCLRHGVPYRVVASLDDARTLSFLREVHVDGVFYCGGGVLRNPFIDAAQGRVLNAHHGPLPQIRGMNACEWALLLGEDPAVSVHYIDRGIDTGPLLQLIPIAVERGATIESLREQCAVAGVEGLRHSVGVLHEQMPSSDPQRAAYKQVYMLAPALREILEYRLRARRISLDRGDNLL